MDKGSFVDEMISRSFQSFSTDKRPMTPASVHRKQKQGPSQFKERFLKELAGIDPPSVQVKAELKGELEVVDAKGRCFYVPTDRIFKV